jgi:copper homeostasis protein (lipoprotein)
MTNMAWPSWMRILPFCGALSAAAACGGAKETPAPAQQEPLFKPIELPAPATMSSTPGVSRFSGVLPCADCSGIRNELVLVQDPMTGVPRTYELVETYLGSMSNDGEKAVTTQGTWSIAKVGGDGAMTIVRLDGGGNADAAKSFERLSDSELRLLDRAQNRIESSHPLTLIRVSDSPAGLALGTLAPAAPPTNSAAPVTLGAGEPAAMVTDLAAGWPVMLKVGQEMTARLAADRAAGGRWSLRAGTDGGIVLRLGEPTYEKKDKAGVEVFRYRAVKPGQTLLTFDYKMGASATATRSVSYPVTVQ